jgi:hypothetical protein
VKRGTVAEVSVTVPGSVEDRRLAAAAADQKSGWRVAKPMPGDRVAKDKDPELEPDAAPVGG